MAQLNKTYDLKTAAAMFGMGHIEFYKMLRGECNTIRLIPSWICTGTYSGDLTNNTPKEWTKKAGYLTTETRGRPAPYNKQISINYSVTVITRHGIMALEKILNKSALPPKPLALTAQNAHLLQAQKPDLQAQKEREKLLAEFNLPIYPAKAS